MTGATPVYAIRHPDGTTKAHRLGDELREMALGVEAALLAAGIPAAPGSDRTVAATDAARNTHFGVPTSEADRLTLQRRGAECVRPDKGWTERYFATYHAATNPTGATPAGWYPVDGVMPSVTLTKTSAQNSTTSPSPLLWDAATGTTGLWSAAARDRIIPNLPGLWRIRFQAVCDLQAANVFVGSLSDKGAERQETQYYTAGNAFGAATVVIDAEVRVVTPGIDYATALTATPGLPTPKVIYPAKANLLARYVGPAR